MWQSLCLSNEHLPSFELNECILYPRQRQLVVVSNSEGEISISHKYYAWGTKFEDRNMENYLGKLRLYYAKRIISWRKVIIPQVYNKQPE